MKTTSNLLAKKIYEELLPEKNIPLDQNTFKNHLDGISQTHAGCSDLLTQLNAAEQQIKFFKTDKEMRIKFPEVWKMQLDLEENKAKNITQKLIDYGTNNELNIAVLLETIDNELNNFTDFFKTQ